MLWVVPGGRQSDSAPGPAAAINEERYLMRQYSEELKASLIARMLPPHNESVPALAQETQIPKDTLYCWRLKARGRVVTPEGGGAAKALSGEEKLAILVETAPMNAHELGAYCRGKGLYPQQLDAWRADFVRASAPAPSRAEREHGREQAREIRALRSELARKEKALAEAAALLVLRKKAQALWGEDEDARSSLRSAEK
jgi:transposase